LDERSISAIVDEVVRKLREGGPSTPPAAAPVASDGAFHGVFATVDEAVNAAAESFTRYGSASLEQRTKAINAIRATTHQIKEHVARSTVEETGIGRVDHKILKLGMAADMTPGVEDISPRHCWSGDNGLTVEEYAPFGVISAVTPVTHPVPTMINNGISMLAGGNTVVFSPHPGSKRIFTWALDKFNRAIEAATGFRNLMTCVAEPTIETTKQAFVHPKVRLLLVTGGPGVVREALATPKKAITAGPGNPPVVVDETAVIAKAAEYIIAGAAFDNNVLCIAEKEVFVVDSVASQLVEEMRKIGCVLLSSDQIDALAAKAFQCKGAHGTATGCGGTTLNRDLVGKRASVLAASIGLQVPEDTPMLIGETSFDNPWVQHEQMMCFLPIVRCRNADEAMEMAHRAEHGYGHTAMIHSLNVATMTKMGRLMNCSLYVKNGPSFAALGNMGEGFTSYSIASPTGEGVTTARTFCRIRRCTMKDYLRVI
jgi:aldehyde dehydrogenase